MAKRQIIYNSLDRLPGILAEYNPVQVLLVCDSAFPHLSVSQNIIVQLKSPVTFNSFSSNPHYDDVVKGVRLAVAERCDFILAVGGGSTLDVAKCIKLFCSMDHNANYLTQDYQDNAIPILAIPTTAGTGSESTRFAVIYEKGEKQSVFHDAILPDMVILDNRVLRTLPVHQKKCTLLDAFCQAIESWWSVNATVSSKKISEQSVHLIVRSIESYLENTDTGNSQMLQAANLAGQAINIAQTTAAHAMSYKLSTLYDIPHGHAAAICLPVVWQYMLNNLDKCSDPRGAAYVRGIFNEIAHAIGYDTPEEAISWINALLSELQITAPDIAAGTDLDLLAGSVNATRLKNNPVRIDYGAALALYKQILNIGKEHEL